MFRLHLDFCLSKSHRVPAQFVNISCSTLASSQFPVLLMDADADLAIWADWEIQNNPGMVLSNFYNSPTVPPIYSVFPCSEAKMKLPLWHIADHRQGWFHGRTLSPEKGSCLQSSTLAPQQFISQNTTPPSALSQELNKHSLGTCKQGQCRYHSPLSPSITQQFWRHSTQLCSAL